MHDIDERLCQLFFQVLYLFRLPLLRLHQVGKKGTPKRDQFEADLNSSLIGEAIKQARSTAKLRRDSKFLKSLL